MTNKAAILTHLRRQVYGATIGTIHEVVEQRLGRDFPLSSVRGRLN